MKVLILGAGGIIGQHLRLHEPRDVEAIYTRRTATYFYDKLELTPVVDVALDLIFPDVIINLAGENSPDVVEKKPRDYKYINENLPVDLGLWCDAHGKYLIQVSSQAVYDGNEAPYPALRPAQLPTPVNAYGRQKLNAERLLSDRCTNWTIARLTFVLGVRPLPMGRKNPFESMIEQLSSTEPQRQVDDRWFSVCFAHDAARVLWMLATGRPLHREIFNVGIPERVSRYTLARRVNLWGSNSSAPTPPLVPVSHSDFVGLAERPKDTTFNRNSMHTMDMEQGFWQLYKDMSMTDERALELAMFFGCGLNAAQDRLSLGFGPNHVKVAEDWRKSNPKTNDEILEWYRSTTAYCWELSAYHADQNFNYSGMCRGISQHLKAHGVKRPIAFGDGIGDLTLSFLEHGMQGVYHDLGSSVTSAFAAFRFARRKATPLMMLTETFDPPHGVVLGDAVVALDFFEHLPNVEEWAQAVFDMLEPGGLFLAQNAFGIGDLEHEGSIPMHLVVNNQYVEGWVPLLRKIGFIQEEGGWWKKP